jgi:hypothetical protein
MNHKAVSECDSVLVCSAHVRSIVFCTLYNGNANLVEIDITKLFMVVYLPSLFSVGLHVPFPFTSPLDINVSTRCTHKRVR